MTDSVYPLEPTAEEMRAMVDQATERVVDHIVSLPEQPAMYSEDGAALARRLSESLPETGTGLTGLLDLLFEQALPVSFNTTGPGYLAYIPGGGVFASAVADYIANAVNRYTGVWVGAPGLVQLEVNVVRWFCEIVGYPAGAGGILTSGGSLANFTAMVTARHERLADNFLRGTIYTSDQTHHSVHKAAVLAGFPKENVRDIPSNEHFEMCLDALQQRINQDRGAGFEPFMVVASAGTTNTGAIDDLNAVADLAVREKLWLHIDAAYGGFFALTQRGRAVMRGIERADSVVLDPHKGLFLPYGIGSLLVRDATALRRTHATSADYMPRMQDDAELIDFCEVSPELSRDFRGLRVWLPIKMYGIETFRASLDEKLDLTAWAADELRAIPDMEIVAEPRLSLVAFRLRPPGLAVEEVNTLNHRLLDAVNARRNVYLTATTLAGRFALRICVLSFRTHRDRMEQCLKDIRESVEELA
jgi:aromatic-L-amino-acid decarboxylase